MGQDLFFLIYIYIKKDNLILLQEKKETRIEGNVT